MTVSTQHPAPAPVASLVGDQPDADVKERRDTLGHQWVTAATSREPAASSVARLQPPLPLFSGSVPGPVALQHPSVLPQPTQYGPHLQHATLVSQPPAHLHMTPPIAANCVPAYSQLVPAQQCDHGCPRSTLASGHDEVPDLCGETPASQGIQQSQDIQY